MQKFKHAMGIDNINTQRNGLLWCDFIEDAYERWALCCSPGLLPRKLKIHIVNKKYLDSPLLEHSVFARSTPKAEQLHRHGVYLQQLHNKTFRLVQIVANAHANANARM
jgi:hypothetical protein